MFSLKERLKLLTRIAQAATPDPTASVAVGAPAAVTPPPPPAFQASGAWGWITNDYNSYTVSVINNLISMLNTALHISSKGQFNWLILRGNSFQVDPSGVPSIDTKNLLKLSQMVYKTFINNGNQFKQKPTSEQIQNWGTAITGSQPFLNLSQLNPTGPIAQKIPGSLKDDILNLIRLLNMYNPLRPQ